MIFKATIDLFFDIGDEYAGLELAAACDATAETLRPLLQEFNPESCLIDWHYSGEQVSLYHPVPATPDEIESLEYQPRKRDLDGESGQDRESYSDEQDRDSYTVESDE